MNKTKMEELLEKYIEMNKMRVEETPSSDQSELRRYWKLVTRLQEELALYEDCHLWLKFTHPDIINEYKSIKDRKQGHYHVLNKPLL